MISGTADGSGMSSTVLKDESADSPLSSGDADNRLKDCWLYVHTGTNAGVQRLISSSTGRSITVADAAGSAYSTDSQYHVHFKLSYTDKVLALNKVLTELLWTKCEQVLTLAQDGAMEESGTASWTAGGGATLTKDTTFANVLPGHTQSLMLVTDADGSYAESVAIPCIEHEPWRAVAWVRPASAANELSLVIRDQTNGADVALSGVTTASGADGNDWVRLHGHFTIPAGCRSIAGRLTDAAASSTSYWADFVPLPPRLYLPLPSWVDSTNDIEQVYLRAEQGFGRQEPVPVHNWNVVVNTNNVAGTSWGGQWIELSGDAYHRVVTVVGRRYYSALSTDSATTNAPLKAVKAALRVELLDRLLKSADQTDKGTWERELVREQRKLAVILRDELPQRAEQLPRLPLRGAWVTKA